MNKKICTKCSLKKELTEFHQSKKFKDGKRSDCKGCRKNEYVKNREKILNYHKTYHINNKEKIKLYRLKNKNKIAIYMKKYRLRNKNKKSEHDKKYRLKNKNYVVIYRLKNKEKINKQDNERQKKRRQVDIQFRLAQNLRTRLNRAVEIDQKAGSAIDDLGCSIGQFKLYLENYFPLYSGMSWNNYGSEWELDHFIPISSFDLTDGPQVKEACHYTNIQPLWIKENRSKSDNLQGI